MPGCCVCLEQLVVEQPGQAAPTAHQRTCRLFAALRSKLKTREYSHAFEVIVFGPHQRPFKNVDFKPKASLDDIMHQLVKLQLCSVRHTNADCSKCHFRPIND